MGNILDEKNTDLNGKVVFDKLKFRTYTIKEILAPQGYLLSDIPYTFDISSTNKDIHLTVENTLEDKEAVTSVDTGQPENPVTPETPNPKDPDSERPISNKPDEREPQENIDTPNAPLGIPNLENPEENINTPNAPLGAPTVETPEENIGTEGNPLGAPTLPKTGGIDSIWFYIVASVFITAGVMIRIKYKL